MMRTRSLEYEDFDLLIEGSQGQYRARVLNSPAGEAEASFSAPLSPLELENFFLRIGRPRQGVRYLGSPEMQYARTFGARLFESVFHDDVYACFRSSLDQVNRQEKGLRIRLRLNAPELSNLPWEYLYNARTNSFLSLANDTPLVRYLDLPQPQRALAIQPPLNILAVISSPQGYPPLDVEREWAQLKEALADIEQQGLVRLERLSQPSMEALRKRLRGEDVHVLHFIGHGKFDSASQEGLLLFEDKEGLGRAVSGSFLASVLHNHRPLRLVVLNACEGARTGLEDPFSGIAQMLVQQGLPAVVAMQFEITDRAAIAFSREFYGALADGYPLDAVLVDARLAVYDLGNDIEWGTPVYFSRAPDGHIFEIGAAKIGAAEIGAAETGAAGTPVQGEPAQPPIPAQGSELDEHLEQMYLDGVEASVSQDWERARAIFQAILQQRPDTLDVQARLADAEHQLELAALYSQAQAGMKAEQWSAAVKALERLVSLEPGYRDVAALLEQARRQEQGAEMFARQELAAGPQPAELKTQLPPEKVPPAGVGARKGSAEDGKGLPKQVYWGLAGFVGVLVLLMLGGMGLAGMLPWSRPTATPTPAPATATATRPQVIATTPRPVASVTMSPAVTLTLLPSPTRTPTAPPVKMLLEDEFDGELNRNWQVFGDPKPVIEQGPGESWLALSAARDARSAGVISKIQVPVQPGVEILIQASSDPEFPQAALQFVWLSAGTEPGLDGLISSTLHLEIYGDKLVLGNQASAPLCSVEMDGSVLHTYLLRVLEGRGIALYVDDTVNPVCELSPDRVAALNGKFSFMGAGIVTYIQVTAR